MLKFLIVNCEIFFNDRLLTGPALYYFPSSIHEVIRNIYINLYGYYITYLTGQLRKPCRVALKAKSSNRINNMLLDYA